MENAIIKALEDRFACKKYDKERHVPDEDFRMILEAGHLSPSSFGFEPWHFIVLEDAGIKKKLYPVCWGAQRSLEAADRFVIILARRRQDLRYDSGYIGHIIKDIQGREAEDAEKRKEVFAGFQLDDFHILESERSAFDWACKQCYIALTSMLLCASSLGIDSCPIEGFDREKTEEILEKEGILDRGHYGVAVMASFGYAAMEQPAKTRQSFDDIVSYV